MDASFWHQRWRTNEIPFHEYAVNQQLFKHFSALSLAKAGRVFVPLCGKSLDIGWLLSRGYAVAGAELSEIARATFGVECGGCGHEDDIRGIVEASRTATRSGGSGERV